MNYFVQLKYRTVTKEGMEKEGVCELYFEEEMDARAFIISAWRSKDVEEASILNVQTEKIIYVGER